MSPKLTFLFLALLSMYSLLSLSFNSWFHNTGELHINTKEEVSNDLYKYSNAFQASFAFDILIFVWALFGFLILRKPVVFLSKSYSFFLILLAIGKFISTTYFLADSDIQKLNDQFKNKYDNRENETSEQKNILNAWKVSYENMYPSIILNVGLILMSVTSLLYISKNINFKQIQQNP